MNLYQPLDLSNLCNAGLSFLPAGEQVRIGRQNYHDLPFVIGAAKPDAVRCLLAFGGEGGARTALTIPLETIARHLIIAHRLLESRLDEGEPVGRTIAHYVVRAADGGEQRIPIRER